MSAASKIRYVTMATCLLIGLAPAFGQQSQFNWKIGAWGGVMSYHGDLVDKFRLIQPTPRTIEPLQHIDFDTWGLSAEKSLTNAWSIGLAYSKGRFTANDRAIDWDGKLRTDAPHFNRALNVETRLNNYNLFLTYYFDNGNLLGRKASLSPFFKIGAGYTHFETFGDLYTDSGRYYYWPDGTIRNQPLGSPQAEIIAQDGVFETALQPLETEGTSYRTTVLTPMTGVGLKLRLFDRMSLQLEYAFYFTQTDYLDDVSGKYPSNFDSPEQAYASNPSGIDAQFRGNPNGNKDFYNFASMSLHYHLGRKARAFHAPEIMTGVLPLWEEKELPEGFRRDVSLEEEQAPKIEEQLIKEVTVDSTVEIIDGDTTVKVVKSIVVRKSPQPSSKVAGQPRRKIEKEIVLQSDTTLEKLIEVDSTVEITGADTVVEVVKKMIEPPIDSAKTTERELEEELIIIEKEEGTVPDTSTSMEKLPVPPDSTLLKAVEEKKVVVKEQARSVVDTTQTLPGRDTSAIAPAPDSSAVKPAPTPDSVRMQPTALPDTSKLATPAVDTLQVQPKSPRDSVKIREVTQRIEISDTTQAQPAAPPTNKIDKDKPSAKPTQPQVDTSKVEKRKELPPAPPQPSREIDALKSEIKAMQAQMAEMKKLERQSAEEAKRIADLNARIADLEKKVQSRQTDPELEREVESLKTEVSNLRQLIQAQASQPTVVVAPPPSQPAPAKNDAQIEALQKQIEGLNRSLDSIKLAKVPAMDTVKVVEPNPLLDSLQRQLIALQEQLARQQKEEAQRLQKEEQARKAAEEAAREAEIKRIQEEAARRQAQLEAEKKKLEQEIAAKEAAEREARQRAELKAKIEALGKPTVYFSVASAELDMSAQEAISRVVKVMLLHPQVRATLQGFADPSGNRLKNLDLANRRAQAVKARMEQMGIAAERLTVIPGAIDTNAKTPEEGRRVEIRLEMD
ncbi:MAG: hypothetical protein KatS3mg030_583 [Saprospiraceae bacterium]|nr:MAG: hypothetical protein KatS3mg030_583 [Saprospiraceae bacterium]